MGDAVVETAKKDGKLILTPMLTFVRFLCFLSAMFVKEVRTMVKLRHPCIVTCMGAVMEPHMEPMMVLEMMDWCVG